MSKKASTTVIGAFVIGAVFLAAAGIVIFGGGKYFNERYSYVIYFNESLKGLNIGAPVLFKGVKIGSVTDIIMEFDAREEVFHVPVIIELTSRRVTVVNHEHIQNNQSGSPDEIMLNMINQGLKAQLDIQSLITGMLYIKLEFFPEKKITLVTRETLGSDIELTEIPSTPSEMDEFTRTFEDLPLKQIVRNLENMTRGIEYLVSSPKIHAVLDSADEAASTFTQTMIDIKTQLASVSSDLKTTISNTNLLIQNVGRQIEPVAEGITDTTDAATGAMLQAQTVLSLDNGPIADLLLRFNTLTETATAALEQFDITLQDVEAIAENDSELLYNLNSAMEEIALAARSIRTAADYLERHPESLLRGKGK